MNHFLLRLTALLVLQGIALSFGVVTLAASTAQAQALTDGMGTTVDAMKDSVVARLANCETQGKRTRTP